MIREALAKAKGKLELHRLIAAAGSAGVSASLCRELKADGDSGRGGRDPFGTGGGNGPYDPLDGDDSTCFARMSQRQANKRVVRRPQKTDSSDGYSDESGSDVEEEKGSTSKWVSCDKCDKWRKLVGSTDLTKLPKRWFCKLNPDPRFNDCSIPEEEEDDPDQRLRAHLRLWVRHPPLKPHPPTDLSRQARACFNARVRKGPCLDVHRGSLDELQPTTDILVPPLYARCGGCAGPRTPRFTFHSRTAPAPHAATAPSGSTSGSRFEPRGSFCRVDPRGSRRHHAPGAPNNPALVLLRRASSGLALAGRPRCLAAAAQPKCCDPNCGKWRALHRSTDAVSFQGKGEWFCVMNTWDMVRLAATVSAEARCVRCWLLRVRFSTSWQLAAEPRIPSRSLCRRLLKNSPPLTLPLTPRAAPPVFC